MKEILNKVEDPNKIQNWIVVIVSQQEQRVIIHAVYHNANLERMKRFVKEVVPDYMPVTMTGVDFGFMDLTPEIGSLYHWLVDVAKLNKLNIDKDDFICYDYPRRKNIDARKVRVKKLITVYKDTN